MATIRITIFEKTQTGKIPMDIFENKLPSDNCKLPGWLRIFISIMKYAHKSHTNIDQVGNSIEIEFVE